MEAFLPSHNKRMMTDGSEPVQPLLAQAGHGATGVFCSGRPSHPCPPDSVLCPICGNMITGAIIGDYCVSQELGSGRNGNAYLATHLRSKQSVVIKLNPPDPMCTGLWDTIRREVRITAALRHPSILSVFRCTLWNPGSGLEMSTAEQKSLTSSERPAPYLLVIRQYITGTLMRFASHYESSQRQLALRRQGIDPLTHLVKLIEQVGATLSVVHSRGIVHGGLVPGNIFIDSDERLWIADFGLTRLHPPPAPYLAPELYAVNRISIQQENMTPFWAAITPACDQYMLAVLCQQLFTRLLRPTDYERLLAVLYRATDPQPGRRFASIDLFVQELVAQTTAGRTTAFARRFAPQFNTIASNPYIHPPIEERRGTPATRGQQASADNTPAEPGHIPIAQSAGRDWEKLGDKLFTGHDYHAALQAYLRVLEVDGKRASVWLALGDTYFALKDYLAALRAYDQAVTLNPSEPQAWSNKGTTLDLLGQHQEATVCYERADQLNLS